MAVNSNKSQEILTYVLVNSGWISDGCLIHVLMKESIYSWQFNTCTHESIYLQLTKLHQLLRLLSRKPHPRNPHLYPCQQKERQRFPWEKITQRSSKESGRQWWRRWRRPPTFQHSGTTTRLIWRDWSSSGGTSRVSPRAPVSVSPTCPSLLRYGKFLLLLS